MCKPVKLTENSAGIEIRIRAEKSDLEIEGNASAHDDVTDQKVYKWIREQLKRGNVWAWCDVEMKVIYRGILSSSAFLGACSYKSEQDFRHDNGYYRDMMGECLDRINEQLVILCGPAPTNTNTERG